jgi:chorismate synthase
MGNTIGSIYRVTSFGESHGKVIGVVVDGCPPGHMLDLDRIQDELDRRRPGQSSVTSPRREEDRVEVLSGVHEGCTTGAPICMIVRNMDRDPAAYEATQWRPRPGHADYTAHVKYGGYGDHRGGGRFSGRITAGHVMAGALAKQLLGGLGVRVVAYTKSIHTITAPDVTAEEALANTESNLVRCPHGETARRMVEAVEEARRTGDSLGGSVECLALNVPPGLGEPAFDTLEGDLSKALFSVPAVKAVEFGAGAGFASMRGSEANDPYAVKGGRVVTLSNHAGGINGGISSGMPVVVRATFRPTPSIGRPQRTVDLRTMEEETLTVDGRHDPCIVPRAVPVVENTVAMVLLDHALMAGTMPRWRRED